MCTAIIVIYHILFTADAAVAYDDLQTGDTLVLLIDQAILIPSIKHPNMSYAVLS